MAITLTKDWQVVSNYNWQPGTGFNFTVYLEAKYISQSQTDNSTKTLTRLRSEVHAGSGSGRNYAFNCSYCNSISGSGLWTFGSEVILESSEKTIYHDSDGTKKLTLYASGYVSGVGFSFDIKGDIVFPKIDRLATMVSANDFNDEDSPTIEFTNPAGFDTAPYLNFYDNNSNIVLRVARESGVYTSPYTWEFTTEERENIRKTLNTQKSYRVNMGVYTYSGETRLGYNSIGKTFSFVNAEPTFISAFEETNVNVINILGSSANKIVKNASKVKTTINPTALKGATIKSVEIIYGTSDVILTASPYEQVLTAVTNTFKVVVTDSRGYVVSEEIVKELIDYSPVEISQYSFKRVNPTSSDIKLSATIKYMQQTFDVTNNTPTIQWKLGENGTLNAISSDDYSIDTNNNEITINNLTLSDVLPYTEQGKLYLLVNDLLTSDAENQLVIVGIPVFDYGEHDFQVNGDLFIADRTRQKPINVLEHLSQDITTNGEPSKTGRKIDGKDEYVKRISVTLGTPSTAGGGTSKSWEIASGLSNFKMTMPLLACIDVDGTIQEANITRFSASSSGITLNATTSHCYMNEDTGIISFITAGSDRSGMTFVANIYFTQNS